MADETTTDPLEKNGLLEALKRQEAAEQGVGSSPAYSAKNPYAKRLAELQPGTVEHNVTLNDANAYERGRKAAKSQYGVTNAVEGAFGGFIKMGRTIGAAVGQLVAPDSEYTREARHELAFHEGLTDQSNAAFYASGLGRLAGEAGAWISGEGAVAKGATGLLGKAAMSGKMASLGKSVAVGAAGTALETGLTETARGGGLGDVAKEAAIGAGEGALLGGVAHYALPPVFKAVGQIGEAVHARLPEISQEGLKSAKEGIIKGAGHFGLALQERLSRPEVPEGTLGLVRQLREGEIAPILKKQIEGIPVSDEIKEMLRSGRMGELTPEHWGELIEATKTMPDGTTALRGLAAMEAHTKKVKAASDEMRTVWENGKKALTSFMPDELPSIRKPMGKGGIEGQVVPEQPAVEGAAPVGTGEGVHPAGMQSQPNFSSPGDTLNGEPAIRLTERDIHAIVGDAKWNKYKASWLGGEGSEAEGAAKAMRDIAADPEIPEQAKKAWLEGIQFYRKQYDAAQVISKKFGLANAQGRPGYMARVLVEPEGMDFMPDELLSQSGRRRTARLTEAEAAKYRNMGEAHKHYLEGFSEQHLTGPMAAEGFAREFDRSPEGLKALLMDARSKVATRGKAAREAIDTMIEGLSKEPMPEGARGVFNPKEGHQHDITPTPDMATVPGHAEAMQAEADASSRYFDSFKEMEASRGAPRKDLTPEELADMNRHMTDIQNEGNIIGMDKQRAEAARRMGLEVMPDGVSVRGLLTPEAEAKHAATLQAYFEANERRAAIEAQAMERHAAEQSAMRQERSKAMLEAMEEDARRWDAEQARADGWANDRVKQARRLSREAFERGDSVRGARAAEEAAQIEADRAARKQFTEERKAFEGQRRQLELDRQNAAYEEAARQRDAIDAKNQATREDLRAKLKEAHAGYRQAIQDQAKARDEMEAFLSAIEGKRSETLGRKSGLTEMVRNHLVKANPNMNPKDMNLVLDAADAALQQTLGRETQGSIEKGIKLGQRVANTLNPGVALSPILDPIAIATSGNPVSTLRAAASVLTEGKTWMGIPESMAEAAAAIPRGVARAFQQGPAEGAKAFAEGLTAISDHLHHIMDEVSMRSSIDDIAKGGWNAIKFRKAFGPEFYDRAVQQAKAGIASKETPELNHVLATVMNEKLPKDLMGQTEAFNKMQRTSLGRFFLINTSFNAARMNTVIRLGQTIFRSAQTPATRMKAAAALGSLGLLSMTVEHAFFEGIHQATENRLVPKPEKPGFMDRVGDFIPWNRLVRNTPSVLVQAGRAGTTLASEAQKPGGFTAWRSRNIVNPAAAQVSGFIPMGAKFGRFIEKRRNRPDDEPEAFE